ncbi:SDR family NAD(P)-dependent oxidoreductase [Lutimonas halocynthiae]|uniref:SDR family NAD(P)-dependent oxidoreductase n=1 Tax=Lutimonas halocynthiae TaxID=1446477 RepID=UPI0025B55194|nr:SDR family NAD(P)-dependent oxidoreductase [Lutimonas halocynthiae]MDN3644034.1 SDR family NAD(P)-dependent oxidoreductase [Lutimonas halocynthiae]
MTDFKTKYGPWALVAGASEGLGAAFAEALAERGLNLILIARRLDKLEDLAQHISNLYSVETIAHSLDLADFKAVKTFVTQRKESIGLLVYNAAYSPIGYFENISEQSLEQIVDVNIKAPLLLSKLVSTRMIERKKGGIVLMASLAGAQGSPKIATYGASKAFNSVFAEGLWNELKKYQIDVLASCAGAISTPGYKNAQNTKDAPGTLSPQRVAEDTLKALGKGPIIIPGFTNKLAYFFMNRVFPRKWAISIMDKNTKDLT